MLNPIINKTVVLKRIAMKIERAVGRIGFISAIGTQGVLRCGDRILHRREGFRVN